MKWLGKIFKFFKSNKPKIGDIVVCVNDMDWNTPQTDIKLVRNRLYKVYDIIEECHFYGYDIGARLTPTFIFTMCNCGKPIKGIGIHWALATRFRKANKDEYIEWLEGELQDSIKSEDYEKASEIKKELDKKKK